MVILQLFLVLVITVSPDIIEIEQSNKKKKNLKDTTRRRMNGEKLVKPFVLLIFDWRAENCVHVLRLYGSRTFEAARREAFTRDTFEGIVHTF